MEGSIGPPTLSLGQHLLRPDDLAQGRKGGESSRSPAASLPCLEDAAVFLLVNEFFFFPRGQFTRFSAFAPSPKRGRSSSLQRQVTMHPQSILSVLLSATAAFACDSCYGPADYDVHTRLVRRQQPEALNATNGPRAPLEWGQLNFLHTTDTHGWLEGHLKEQNYGADWGDYVTFTRRMKQKAGNLGVDLLLLDTGTRPNHQRQREQLH